MRRADLTPDDYTVAWICPLEVEQIAAMEMLDEEHKRLPQPQNDHNTYTLGSICGHNVVIAGLPGAGSTSAATVVAQMRNTYRQLRFGLLVGIGGGVPTRTDAGPIRLGHVVVSKPTGQHSGAIQYDHGKAESGGFRRTGFLAAPPNVLLNAAQRMGAMRARAREDPVIHHVERINTLIHGLRKYKYPGVENDFLYQPDYIHSDREKSCRKCGCDAGKRVMRDVEDSDEDEEIEETDRRLVVHRGTIAAGEKVMRDGLQRDELAKQHGILCFEMEAAGALNDFPCLVIRGISDYSDSHKNDKWHGYAAAAAAAYARELFFHMPVDEVKQCQIAESDVRQMIRDTRTLALSSTEAKIKSWLSPVDTSSNYIQARSQCHQGTGQWFLENDQYVKWKAQSINFLWLHGIPGCGKSVLSSTIIDDLQKGEGGAKQAPLYFFFDFNNSDKQIFESMLRSLVFQLYQQNQNSQKLLDHLYSSCQNGKEPPQNQALSATLQSMIAEVGDVQIVLDALDECRSRKNLLSWLALVSNNDVQVLVTSRREEDIESSLTKWMSPTHIVSIQHAVVNEDIRAVVRSRLDEDEELQRWQPFPEVRKEIEDKLMTKADGMFRWATCQLDALTECLDLPSLEHTLSSLPTTLHETYHRILNQIPDGHRSHAIRLLQFLAFAKRPLRLEEAVDAIAVKIDRTPAFEERNRMPRPQEIVRVCSSLANVTTRKVDALTDDDDFSMIGETITELQLAHFSVKEYLVSDKVAESFRPHFQRPRAEAAIVRVSLAYLSAAASSPNADNPTWGLPFEDFCAQNWIKHAFVAEQEEGIAEACTNMIFSSPDVYQYWLRLFNPNDLFERPKRLWGPTTFKHSGPSPEPLYYASLGGLVKSVELLLNRGADVNVKGPFGRVLVAASREGHKEVVNLLLERNVSVNAGHGIDTALVAASIGGHKEIVELLLDWGANFGASKAHDALRFAAKNGHKEIVELLLDRGADVNEAGGEALATASFQGYQETVELLLDRGVDVSAAGGRALVAASEGGNQKIVELLLDRGVDISAAGGRLLVSASERGNQKIVELLLDRGADINAKGGKALVNAASEGHKHTVELLLDRGGGHAGDDYRDALAEAAGRGRKEIAELLLDRGAVRLGDDYSEALAEAAINGEKEIVELLLDRSVVLARDDFSYALAGAAKRCDKEMVKLLLDRGVVLVGDDYSHALASASREYQEYKARQPRHQGPVYVGDEWSDTLSEPDVDGELEILALLALLERL